MMVTPAGDRIRRSVRCGFTLIELLVVIAIIAILAAILFPVFAQAREAARKTTCLSNTKQVSLGMVMYAQDYDETFPNVYVDMATPTGTRRQVWVDFIQPYVKNGAMFRCPSATTAKSVWYSPSGLSSNYCLAMNGHIFQEGATKGPTMGQFTVPAERLMAMDGTNFWTHYCPLDKGKGCYDKRRVPSIYSCLTTSQDWGAGVPTWHQDGANTSFFDGHAKWWPGDKLAFDANAWGHNGL